MLGLALAFALPVVVLSDTPQECPSTAEVQEALRSAGDAAPADPPAAAADPAARTVRLRREGPLLLLDLYDAQGLRRKRRALPTQTSCAALAASAAVVISAWEGELPTQAPRHGIHFAPPPKPPPPPPPLPFEVSGAALLALGSEGLAPAGALAAALGPRGGRLSGLVSLFGAGLRRLSLADGMADYTRCGAGLGAQAQLLPGRLRADLRLRAQLLLAGTLARGVGFLTNREGYSLDLGLSAGARLGLAVTRTQRARLVPFVDLALVGWLRPQQLVVAGQASLRELPHIDLWLGLGLAFGSAV